MKGLKDGRIKYIVKAKKEESSLAQLVETALQEESEVKSQKFKRNQNSLSWPNAGNRNLWNSHGNCDRSRIKFHD
jgi:hypothetical protein